jgi:hypothetical protein
VVLEEPKAGIVGGRAPGKCASSVVPLGVEKPFADRNSLHTADSCAFSSVSPSPETPQEHARSADGDVKDVAHEPDVDGIATNRKE